LTSHEGSQGPQLYSKFASWNLEFGIVLFPGGPSGLNKLPFLESGIWNLDPGLWTLVFGLIPVLR